MSSKTLKIQACQKYVFYQILICVQMKMPKALFYPVSFVLFSFRIMCNRLTALGRYSWMFQVHLNLLSSFGGLRQFTHSLTSFGINSKQYEINKYFCQERSFTAECIPSRMQVAQTTLFSTFCSSQTKVKDKSKGLDARLIFLTSLDELDFTLVERNSNYMEVPTFFDQ